MQESEDRIQNPCLSTFGRNAGWQGRRESDSSKAAVARRCGPVSLQLVASGFFLIAHRSQLFQFPIPLLFPSEFIIE